MQIHSYTGAALNYFPNSSIKKYDMQIFKVFHIFYEVWECHVTIQHQVFFGNIRVDGKILEHSDAFRRGIEQSDALRRGIKQSDALRRGIEQSDALRRGIEQSDALRGDIGTNFLTGLNMQKALWIHARYFSGSVVSSGKIRSICKGQLLGSWSTEIIYVKVLYHVLKNRNM